MGINIGLTLLKTGEQHNQTSILRAFGIQNPVTDHKIKGYLPYNLTQGVAIGKINDCWLVFSNEISENAIQATPSTLEQRLAAAFPDEQIMLYGSFDTAMVYWFLLLENGQRIRLKTNAREEDLNIGTALPEETSLYKSVRMEEEGIEVYEWWAADKTQTRDYTATQVGGNLGDAVCGRLLGQPLSQTNIREIEFTVFVDEAYLEQLRHQKYQHNNRNRIEYVAHRFLPKTDFEQYFLLKNIPVLEAKGFEYQADLGYFTKKIPLFELRLGFWYLHDPSKSVLRMMCWTWLFSEKLNHFFGENYQYEQDRINMGSLMPLNLERLDRKVIVQNAETRILSPEMMCHYLESYLYEVVLPAIDYCETPKNLLPCINNDYLIPYLSLQNLPELAVQLFRAEFERAEKEAQKCDFSKTYGSLEAFNERFAYLSEEEKHTYSRLSFKFKGIEFQPNIVTNKAEIQSALHQFTMAYWARFFPNAESLVLGLPHRDVLKIASPLPFDQSQKTPLLIGEATNIEEITAQELPKNIFQRFFAWFTTSKPETDGQNQKGKDFFSSAIYARANVSIVLNLRKGKPVSGVKEFIDGKLSHFPEFHQPEHQFWVISAYGKADPEMAFPLLEQNTFEDLAIDIERNYQGICRNLDWLASWSFEYFEGEKGPQILDQSARFLLKNTLYSSFNNLKYDIARIAKGLSETDKASQEVRRNAHIWNLFFEVMDAILNIPSGHSNAYIQMQRNLEKLKSYGAIKFIVNPKDAVLFTKTIEFALFERFPLALGLNLNELTEESISKNFLFKEDDFSREIDFQIALTRSKRLRLAMEKQLNAVLRYVILADQVAVLEGELLKMSR
jgi:hypothetical protein